MMDYGGKTREQEAEDSAVALGIAMLLGLFVFLALIALVWIA